jgi:hypothetical protein
MVGQPSRSIYANGRSDKQNPGRGPEKRSSVLKLRKKESGVYEADLPIDRVIGLNLVSEKHSSLAPGEFRELTNVDVIAGINGELDVIKSRRGSRIVYSSMPEFASLDPIPFFFDVGNAPDGFEYMIFFADSRFYSQRIGFDYLSNYAISDPVMIKNYDNTEFSGNFVPTDIFRAGDKLMLFGTGFVFNNNYVIQWYPDTETFKIRPMGMSYPVISSLTAGSEGTLIGKYIWGIEKVYRVNGQEFLASTPNRKNTARIIQKLEVTLQKGKLVINPTELDNDGLWTHIRLWRTKNMNHDFTDPLNPIDAQGTEGELFEVALITKAALNVGSLTAIATGATLPPGNANVTAGKPAGAYTIEDNNSDAYLFLLQGIDQIELLPMPRALTGAFLDGRIFVSNVSDDSVPVNSKSDIYYSPRTGTKYSEQYDPQAFISTGRDGIETSKLIAFENDLLVLKENKVGYLRNADVNEEFLVTEHHTGIVGQRSAFYVPGVGILAVTFPDNEVRFMGQNFKWNRFLGDIDLYQGTGKMLIIANFMISWAYKNGKIFMHVPYLTNGTSGSNNLDEKRGTFVLNIQERRGWVRYEYEIGLDIYWSYLVKMNRGTVLLLESGKPILQIEVDGLDTDDNIETGQTENPINCHITTHQFQSNAGRHLLEHHYLSLFGEMDQDLIGVPYKDEFSWPDKTSEEEFEFVVPPDDLTTGEKEKEYRLYLEPRSIGNFAWNRMIGNRFHYKLRTEAPFNMKIQSLRCIIDEEGMGFNGLETFGCDTIVIDPTESDILVIDPTATDIIQIGCG